MTPQHFSHPLSFSLFVRTRIKVRCGRSFYCFHIQFLHLLCWCNWVCLFFPQPGRKSFLRWNLDRLLMVLLFHGDLKRSWYFCLRRKQEKKGDFTNQTPAADMSEQTALLRREAAPQESQVGEHLIHLHITDPLTEWINKYQFIFILHLCQMTRKKVF